MSAQYTPFLFRFSRPCISPGREQPSPEYAYDRTVDLVRWLGREDHPPAIEASGVHMPQTKKNDLEKGEDSKDRRMWL
jgi:hypothetical protein